MPRRPKNKREKMKKTKTIARQRMEAVIEDMKIQAEEMGKISRPKRFIDKLIAFGRMRIIAEIMIKDIEIAHVEKQTKILQGKYDSQLRGIVMETVVS